MAADTELVRLDIGFDGGAVLSMSVPVREADALEERLRSGDGTLAELHGEDGRLLVVLARVAYVRRHPRSSRVGFSASR